MIPMTKAAVLVLSIGSIAFAEDTGRCEQVRIGLESDDLTEFEEGLQKLLTNECYELLPRVAELFRSRKAPSIFLAADTLALSRQKEYGPLLIEAYFDASRRAPGSEFGPSSLRQDILLACSDISRGNKLRDVDKPIEQAPGLDKRCIERYRALLRQASRGVDECVARDVALAALDLLRDTSAVGAMDIIKEYFGSGDSDIREEAVAAMEKTPVDASLPLLKQALADEHEGVRFQAVRVLALKEGEEVVELLRSRLAVETYPPTTRMLKARLAREEKSKDLNE